MMETKIEKLPENVVKVDIQIPAKEAVEYGIIHESDNA